MAAPAGLDWVLDARRLLQGEDAPVIFDVGANTGEVTLRLVKMFPPSARIHAFEPAAATFMILAEKLRESGNVTPHQCALSDKEGQLTLFHGVNSHLHRLAPASSLQVGSSEQVVALTIDIFASTQGLERISLLKTDTEGFDTAVLRGASRLLLAGAIRIIVSEATFDRTSSWHTRFDELRDLLEPLGYHLHGIYEAELWGTHLKYANVMFVRADEPPSTRK